MPASLTLILPIRNAAATLRQEVEHMLEILAESAADFELLIVDLGSTDDSFELSAELTREFPQVRSLRKELAQSLNALVAKIRAGTESEVIVHGGLSEMGDLERMWRRTINNPAFPELAKGPKRLGDTLLGQLARWGERVARRSATRIMTRPTNFLVHLRELANA